MSDAYNTIEIASEGEFKDRGSRFIAYLFPIQKEEDFKERMQELKKAHLKACHHCSAFRLREGLSRSSDDGEPSGSAGKPMLNQLLSEELVDVGLIVVRYFGGTKLGVSGLINAYKVSSKLALESADIKIKYLTTELLLNFDYAIMGTLMDCLKYLNLEILAKDFAAKPSLILAVRQSEVDSTIVKIKARMLGRAVTDIEEDTEVAHLSFEKI